MKDEYSRIKFDRTKSPTLDFEILSLEKILSLKGLDHNPRDHHRVDFYVLIIVTSGQGTHTIDFKPYDYTAQSVLTIRKDQIHSFGIENAKGFILIFTEEFAISHSEASSSDQVSTLFNELLFKQHGTLNSEQFEEVLLLINHIQNELDRKTDEHSKSIIGNLLHIIIRQIQRTRSPINEDLVNQKYTGIFLQFQKLIERHWQESRTVQYYADKLNVSTKTINKVCQETIKETAKTFIDQQVILNSKRLLINTKKTIKEIAYMCGFDEPTNFYKFFKRSTRKTPESFRIKHSNKS